jgi:hypothetical protein
MHVDVTEKRASRAKAGIEDPTTAWLRVSSSCRLLGQTELNPHTSGKINRLSVTLRRPKADLFCRPNCCFIKTVA